MKKIITTFCIIALSTLAVQAQGVDATDRAQKKTQVKKEAPAKLMNADEKEAQAITPEQRKAQMEAREKAIQKRNASAREANVKKNQIKAEEKKQTQKAVLVDDKSPAAIEKARLKAADQTKKSN